MWLPSKIKLKLQDSMYKHRVTARAKTLSPSNDHFRKQFIKWNTFMKENYDIFATWYLGLNLYLFQRIMLHYMGTCTTGIIIASRGIDLLVPL